MQTFEWNEERVEAERLLVEGDQVQPGQVAFRLYAVDGGTEDLLVERAGTFVLIDGVWGVLPDFFTFAVSDVEEPEAMASYSFTSLELAEAAQGEVMDAFRVAGMDGVLYVSRIQSGPVDAPAAAIAAGWLHE